MNTTAIESAATESAPGLRTVRLYGTLGAKFGRLHRLAVASCAEAVQALAVLLPGFESHILASKDRGVGYACFLGQRNLPPERLADPAGSDDIRIAPIVQGSKRGGLFSIVLGAALFFAAPYVAPAFVGALGEGAAIMLGNAVASLGTALMLGGVMQLLSPQQRGISTKDSPDNGASYNFNGPVNTTAQGNPAPVLYGELIVGSSVISAGIYAEDQQ